MVDVFFVCLFRYHRKVERPPYTHSQHALFSSKFALALYVVCRMVLASLVAVDW